MRICIAVRALPIHRLGGLEFHTLDLANALAGLGHEVVLITSCHPQGKPSEMLASGVECRYAGSGSPGNYSRAFFRDIGRECETIVRHRRVDVLHAQEFAGLFLKPPSELPLVCTIHGTMFTEVPLDRRYRTHLSLRMKLEAAWRYKSRLLLHPFFLSVLRRAHALVVDSDFTRRELLMIDTGLVRKLHRVPLGLDFMRYGQDPQMWNERPARNFGSVFTVVLLGRMQEMKGIGIALEAAQILSSRSLHFKMIIGGSGPYSETAARFIERNGLERQVKLAGNVPPEGVPDFIKQGDVFLFPDLTQPAFGLVAVEAMLIGVPVVGARSGAIPEVVTEETGWIYSSWSSAELAALLGRLILNPSEVNKKGAAARLRAAQFTARNMAMGVERVYAKVVT